MITLSEVFQKKINEVEMTEIEDILKIHNEEKGNIITLLQHIQEKFGYLPSHVLNYVSHKLKISLAEIYGVATFYAQFSFNEKGKYVITSCDGTACHVKNGTLILEYIEKELGIKSGETTEDKLFSIETVACLGCCAIAPVCVINEEVYGNLTIKKMQKILNKIKKAEEASG